MSNRKRKYATPEEAKAGAAKTARERQQELQVSETGLKGLKDMTPAERTAAKTEYQRRYRELKRLAEGRPKRGRKKYATPEAAKEAARAYHRAYGKMYRALKKSGTWQPRVAKRDGGCGMRNEKGGASSSSLIPHTSSLKPGRRPAYATEEERRAAKNEYNRKYHLLRKTGLWVRKNRVFSERVAKRAGVLTVKEQIAAAMEAKRCGRGGKVATAEELREHLRIYNREYRQRKRAEALAIKQRTWTADEWAAWEKREAAKGRGKPEQFVKEVVKVLAESGRISEDEVMCLLLEKGGLEFLMSGAEAIGKDRAKKSSMVRAAAMAVAFYIGPDGAVMFPVE